MIASSTRGFAVPQVGTPPAISPNAGLPKIRMKKAQCLQWSLSSLYQATHSVVAHGYLPGVLLKPFHG